MKREDYELQESTHRVMFAFKINDEYRKVVGGLKEIQFTELKTIEYVRDYLYNIWDEGYPAGLIKGSGIIKKDPLRAQQRYQSTTTNMDKSSWDYYFEKEKWYYEPMIGYAIAFSENMDATKGRDDELHICYEFAKKQGNYCDTL